MNIKKYLDAREEPIRSEIFTPSRLEGHGESLARAQAVFSGIHQGQNLISRVRQNKKVLEECYVILLQAIAEKRSITPAAEWLVDNFHIVRSLLKDIRAHLPPQFYNQLPKLSEGHLAGYPRVYGIAWAFVAHSDSLFDADHLSIFLKSYQKICPLSIGELWAIPITIKIVMIENLRRFGVRIVASQIARKEADDVANEVLNLREEPSRSCEEVVEGLRGKTVSSGFLVQLLQRLQFQDPNIDPLLEWIEENLRTLQTNSNEIVLVEHSAQTAANATVRNIIVSSRLMTAFEWRNFFEDVSLVEKIFRRDAGYAKMDFTTRDRYRHALEELARFSEKSENEVAELVLAAAHVGKAERDRDVGFYLISTGRQRIEKEIKFKSPLKLSALRFYRHYATPLYLGLFCAFTILITAFMVPQKFEVANHWVYGSSLLLLALFPASEMALAILNRLTVGLLGPRYLARLSLDEGVPSSMRTFVVVPTMLTDKDRIAEQVEQLEIYYLSNPGPNLYFALLSDGVDASDETINTDEEFVTIAQSRVAELNHKYKDAFQGENRFFVYHRSRLYNAQEGVWMGWERKRGKLQEFNRALINQCFDGTSFKASGGKRLEVPVNMRFVVTLDADTRLPRGSLKQLIGSLAHPLNQAQFDPLSGRVIHGYSILQPRVTPALPSSLKSTTFQKLTIGDPGIDPYSSAISDVYQDLFGEGSFTGKGIYDVHAFEKAIGDHIPENYVLSHDLLEGNYARCGFLSDVEFVEEFPAHTEVQVSRSHRWTRGDWQLLPWIFSFTRGAMPLIGRWKMFDNLRRSLVVPTSFLLSILALMQLGPGASGFVLIPLLCVFLGPLIAFLSDVTSLQISRATLNHLRLIFRELPIGIARSLLFLSLMPHQAAKNLDAIIRAVYRQFMSQKKMLEWTTAAQVQAAARLSIGYFLKAYWPSFIFTAVTASAVAVTQPQLFFKSLPLWILWLAAPWIAQKSSSPPKLKILKPLGAEDIDELKFTARRIWRYFTTFVTVSDHFLPPDNFQETPVPIIAHRSSPTNFGLYLLSVIAAKDFGWVGQIEMAERLGQTMKSLKELPRFKGHFFNWYDTSRAEPLLPKYISSVDNGNLAGHLLVVAQGCLEVIQRPQRLQNFTQGFTQTFNLLYQLVASLTPSAEVDQFLRAFDELKKTVTELDSAVTRSPEELRKIIRYSNLISSEAQSLNLRLSTTETSEILAWSKILCHDVDQAARDLQEIYPWQSFASVPPPAAATAAQKEIWTDIVQRLGMTPGVGAVPAHVQLLLVDLMHFEKQIEPGNLQFVAHLQDLYRVLETASRNSQALSNAFKKVHDDCLDLFHEMDFGILYEPTRKLFSIGYRVSDEALDPSYYDLLASEARLTSFIAIAKGDVPAAHWFHLGRALTPFARDGLLVSWSGSMFEYLMPSLVMRDPAGSLIDHSCRLAVQRQIQYGKEKHIPWGISESAYNVRDMDLTYQYSNFGIPDLGLKRGLGADTVVAPYASFLAAMYDTAAASVNLRRLKKIGGLGVYGFFEAIDFTVSRLQEGQKHAVVQTYMAHHQGMSLVAIANIFTAGAMRDRFHEHPIVRSAELLLEERVPRNMVATKRTEESPATKWIKEELDSNFRTYHNINRAVPTTQLLSNSEYSVMLTSSGAGYSRCKGLGVTRWREDVTQDHWGSFFYLRDVKSQKTWSATYQPTCVEAESFEANFFEERARFRHQKEKILCEMEVLVSPEDNVEVRKITLTNLDSFEREIELTSYSEVVLAPPLADAAHTTFSNLFVQTVFLPGLETILAHRRPRSAKESEIWGGHVVLQDHHSMGQAEFETDRAKFIGRGQSTRHPEALRDFRSLSGTQGAVLDPVFSLRVKVRLAPGAKSQTFFSTLMATDRDEATHLAEKFRDIALLERVSNAAWTQSQVKIHYLNIEPNEAHVFQRLAARLFFSDPSLRISNEMLKQNTKDVTSLWKHGISGDLPIILVRIDDFEDRAIVRQLLKAHYYLNSKGLRMDLVILNDQANSYAQDLQRSLEALVHNSIITGTPSDAYGKIFVLKAESLTKDDVNVIYVHARAVLSSRQGSLSEQVKRTKPLNPSKPVYADTRVAPDALPELALALPLRKFENGLGGFSESENEYVIHLKGRDQTPVPWLNVIANANFGFQTSESGSGFTWSMNSRENQLTPWQNDPICDPSSEAFYFYDRDSEALWSPTALPIRCPDKEYVCRHGQGYSRFEHVNQGISSDMTKFVPWEQSVKVSLLRIKNNSKVARRLSIFGYVEWTLGFSRPLMAPTTITEFNSRTQMIFAKNSRNSEFNSRVSYAGFRSGCDSYTADRSEFLGRNGSAECPAGVLRNEKLSGRFGAKLDPCAALQKNIELEPGQEIEIVFFLGQGADLEQAQSSIQYLQTVNLEKQLREVKMQWNRILDKVRVKTPDESLNLILNRWLLYQTLVCRFWARAALYQVGGAYGFRDQLQDCMALAVSEPALAREHILRAASRQFVEGDVQHWWHPPSGRGVRTHFSDDLIWLPYTVLHYLRVTEDSSILSHEISYIEGPALRPDQEDSYYTPEVSHNGSDLFEHCARALDRSLPTGAHGLPLIGAGDWNDGMNRVGHEGKGESVWLGWFLYTNLVQFAEVAKTRGEIDRAEKWISHAAFLKTSLENAWDGKWYRRAYFDDGTPLGSDSQAECKIDSLSQTWAVISGAADKARARQAMNAVGEYLVKPQDKMILLFTPPFDKTTLDPGYIKGYLPGVRENGGQYTHAATWCVVAQAMMGENEKAAALFSMLNPINHSLDPKSTSRYKVEPYVLAADVYSQAPYTGRGGWTWYTGSSGWMYRAGVEFILGFEVVGSEVFLHPCVPVDWNGFEVKYRHGASEYLFNFRKVGLRAEKVKEIIVDGKRISARDRVKMIDDGQLHIVDVSLMEKSDEE